MRTTPPATLVVAGALSAPAGAAVGPVAQWIGGTVPSVPWTTVASPWVLAMVVGVVAWHTWRSLGGPPPWRRDPDGPGRDGRDGRDQGGPAGRPSDGAQGPARPRRETAGSTSRRPAAGRPLEPHQAVNRLVLGKAAAIAGAVCAGAYVGFAVAAAGGIDRQLDGERVAHALVAALGGLALLTAGLLLERACRTPDEPTPA